MRRCRMKKSHHCGILRIGLVVNTSSKPSSDVLLGAVSCLRSYGIVRPLLFLANGGTRPENIKVFAGNDIDGLLFCGVRREVVCEFFRLMPDHPPLVVCVYTPFLEEERKLMGNGGQVVLDNEAIGEKAAEFFIGHGLRHFAFLGSNVYRERIAGRIRRAAFKEAISARLGDIGTFSEHMVGILADNEDFWEVGLGNSERWAKSLPLPCGILVNGDREAFNLINLCMRMGIDVPEKVEILGINNAHGFCEQSSPTISSIFPGTDALAQSAVRMLMELVANPALPEEKRFERVAAMRLVERGSTSCGRNYGNVITKVREYVRLNACSGIGVPEVVKHVGISRRLLEKRIRESMDMSLLELIQSVRLANVCRLLTTTDLTITEVTLQSGYELTSNLGTIFRKKYGMSMREYRNRHADRLR